MRVTVASVTLAILLRELHDGPSSISDLQEVTGLARSTLYVYIREFRKTKLIYIAGYGKDSGNRHKIPLHAWGPGKRDVKTTTPLTSAERSRNYRKAQHERAIHQRLTLLGTGAGLDQNQKRRRSISSVEPRPDHGREQMV